MNRRAASQLLSAIAGVRCDSLSDGAVRDPDFPSISDPFLEFMQLIILAGDLSRTCSGSDLDS